MDASPVVNDDARPKRVDSDANHRGLRVVYDAKANPVPAGDGKTLDADLPQATPADVGEASDARLRMPPPPGPMTAVSIVMAVGAGVLLIAFVLMAPPVSLLKAVPVHDRDTIMIFFLILCAVEFIYGLVNFLKLPENDSRRG